MNASALERWFEAEPDRIAVVGVGNPLRGDDGAGPCAVSRLQGRTEAMLLDAETVPENYLGALLAAGIRRALFVDAAEHGGPPGSCCLAPVRDLAPRLPSTHAPSLALLAELLEARGIECWLLGIQPASTALGASLSLPVERAVTDVVAAMASARKRSAP